jgi:DNA-binding NarL/FixJ family response regulator
LCRARRRTEPILEQSAGSAWHDQDRSQLVAEGLFMRILLADNRARTRFALRTLLGQVPGIEIAGEAGDAASLLAEVEAACPDLVLLDWGLRDLAVAGLFPGLRKLCPGLRVIALSGRAEDENMVLAAGADSFVCKADPVDSLLEAVHHYCCRQRGERDGGASHSSLGTAQAVVGSGSNGPENPPTYAQGMINVE